jgi:hypothetical protein
MLEGQSCLVHLWQGVVGNVRVCFVLAGLRGVGDEAQPRVSREVWRTEIDQLLTGDAGLDDSIRCRRVDAVLKHHLHRLRAIAQPQLRN